MKQIFELYRMECKAFTPVNVLDYESGSIAAKDLSAENHFRSMFTNKPPFDKMNRYLLISSDAKLLHPGNEESRDASASDNEYVYEPDNETQNFVPAYKYSERARHGLEEQLKETRAMRDIMAKLTGTADIDQTKKIFKHIKNNKKFHLCATIGNRHYTLFRTPEFIKPYYDVYIPILKDSKIELQAFEYSNIIYIHHDSAALSWIALPEGCNYIVDRGRYHNQSPPLKPVSVYNTAGKRLKSSSNLEALKLSKHLAEYAYTGSKNDFINLLQARISIEIE